jgi:hypothetical protein
MAERVFQSPIEHMNANIKEPVYDLLSSSLGKAKRIIWGLWEVIETIYLAHATRIETRSRGECIPAIPKEIPQLPESDCGEPSSFR